MKKKVRRMTGRKNQRENFSKENDWEFLRISAEYIENKYIWKRLKNRLEWYLMTYHCYIGRYNIVSIISIVMPTAVILLNDMQDYSNMQVFCKVGISMASSIAAIANGVGSLYQWHDRAVEYRSCAEKIKSETVRYIAGLGEYEDVMEKDPLFLNYLETISLSENENWIAGENSGRGANQH